MPQLAGQALPGGDASHLRTDTGQIRFFRSQCPDALEGHAPVLQQRVGSCPDPPAPIAPPCPIAQPVSVDLIPELQRLGQRLEQARQAQGLSREEQAERLHMGIEQLRALEQGDRAELPEAVFVVAQARRVAASLGLNIDAEVAALRGNAAFQAQPAKRRDPQQTATATATATQRARTAGAEPPAVRASDEQHAVQRASRPRGPALSIAVAVAAALALAGGAIALLQRGGLPTAQLPSDSGQQPQADPKAPDPEPDLLVYALQPSWLEVRSGSGQVLFRGTLQGERRFPLSGELRVLAGRPDLVRITIPGEQARVLGPIEAVRWRSFRQADPQAPEP